MPFPAASSVDLDPSLRIRILFKNASHDKDKDKPTNAIEFTADFLLDLSFDSLAAFAFRMAHPIDEPNEYNITYKYRIKDAGVQSRWVVLHDNKGLVEAIKCSQCEGLLLVSAIIVKKCAVAPPTGMASLPPEIRRPPDETTLNSSKCMTKKSAHKKAANKMAATTKYKPPSQSVRPPTRPVGIVEQKILDALKRYLECNVTDPDRIMIALQSGYKHLGSIAFSTAMKNLLASKWIAYPSTNTVRITELGMASAGLCSARQPLGNGAFHQLIRIKLDPVSLKIFDRLLLGSTLQETELAVQVGYSNVFSKAFATAMKNLKALRLIEVTRDPSGPRKQFIRLSHNAFPCGRPNKDTQPGSSVDFPISLISSDDESCDSDNKA